MYRPSIIVLLACLAASGCSTSSSVPDVGGASGVVTWSGNQAGQPGVDRGTVFHWGSLFVIWTDAPTGGGGSTSSNMQGGSCTGQLIGANGEVLKFTCKTSDGKSGTATIAGQSYDLQKGSLFLAVADDDGWQVKQLNRDLQEVPLNKQGLRKLAESDEEIQEFFGSAASGE
ncbi:hypothetical protein NG895_04750 [Aeoliella sp. ICT_H6.2]|uniref:Uncharacterized protein n=1 Tax=Aeoliella straminimaris TaxID=2954799 RepID=A0A9X2FC09_9BACT|nr:hypothetical protein [Aeoliella straminimaris]MCO6043206.1 hypothetical protein [Aeoliella straminimaris]